MAVETKAIYRPPILEGSPEADIIRAATNIVTEKKAQGKTGPLTALTQETEQRLREQGVITPDTTPEEVQALITEPVFEAAYQQRRQQLPDPQTGK